MFRIEPRDREELPDVIRFVDLATSGAWGFTASRGIFAARAPGRLDVMGGIADYSGSLVLPMPIREACVAGVQKRADGLITIAGLGEDREHRFQIPAAKVHELTSEEYRGKWHSYIAGVFTILAAAKNVDFSSGATVLVSSDVPIGKGVSSSAAIEVSTMAAVCAAFEIDIEPRELAILCQRVENTIVGAACGVMDQMASHCGKDGALLSMLCQPAEVNDPVTIPTELDVWGVDSGVRHAVSGSDYSSVRAAAFMGYKMLANAAGSTWNGYLANLLVEEYELKFLDLLPESVSGAEFLKRFPDHGDHATAIDAEKSYSVRASAEFGIYENDRVKKFTDLLEGAIDNESATKLGELMYDTHEGYRRCGLTEQGTELLVGLARERAASGIYGARITGGGSGGTVAILASSEAGDTVKEIASEYTARTGREPRVFHGSGPGCDEYGIVRLVPQLACSKRRMRV